MASIRHLLAAIRSCCNDDNSDWKSATGDTLGTSRPQAV